MNTPLFVVKNFILLSGSAAILGLTQFSAAAETIPIQTEAANAAAAPTHSGTVTVKKGDTLYRIIARNLEHLPFKQDIVRAAIMQKNPAAFKDGKPSGMISGAVLQLPRMADFRRMIPALAATSEDAQAEQDADPRKGWVRFP